MREGKTSCNATVITLSVNEASHRFQTSLHKERPREGLFASHIGIKRSNVCWHSTANGRENKSASANGLLQPL